MLLEVKNLKVKFHTRKGTVRAVNDVSFSLERGKTLGLVGESGSGKSVSAMSILRLLDENGEIESGEILFDEGGNGESVDLAKLKEEQMRALRGNKISVIFQEPMTALNPVLSVRRQLTEPFFIHRKLSKKQAEEEALKMLKAVGLPDPKQTLFSYPHNLSGGMRQRVMIAMALACDPKLLIADEPTTALDVTMQAQILNLTRTLQRQTGTAILLITHDLGVVNENADDVAVAYCGEIVELAPKNCVFGRGKYSHPYTEGLLRSTPDLQKTRERLYAIEGNVPSPWELPKGCKFAPRCPYRTQKCVETQPPLFKLKNGQSVRCYYPDKEERKGGEHAKLVIRGGT